MKHLLFVILLVSLMACQQKTPQSPNKVAPDQFPMGQIIDLTYDFSDETIYWVTSKEFELDVVAKGQTDKGYYYSANNITTAEHGGTHLDAPIHFAENQQSVDQIPLENLIGSGIKISLSEQIKNNPDYQIGVDDLISWEDSNQMKIPDNSIILLETGFGLLYPDKLKYLGTDQRGPDAVRELHFPGLSPEAAVWLVKNRNIKAIGLDTPSIDYGQSTNFESHVILLKENIPVFENVANLHQLPSDGFKVIALPMKIKNGSGAPLRIIAILTDQSKNLN